MLRHESIKNNTKDSLIGSKWHHYDVEYLRYLSHGDDRKLLNIQACIVKWITPLMNTSEEIYEIFVLMSRNISAMLCHSSCSLMLQINLETHKVSSFTSCTPMNYVRQFCRCQCFRSQHVKTSAACYLWTFRQAQLNAT